MELTIEDFHKALESKAMTVEDLVTYYLRRIEAFDQSGPKINAVICVNPQAITEAKNLDERFDQDGLTGALHGVPVILKDNVETVGLETTAGSQSLKGYIPDGDAFIVQKLKAAGAIILAKANLHEFAIWGETISSILGQTLNPYDLTRTPGGSSGGTGAALASNFGLVGIGTDTINSVRSPAAANSIVGIRPTVGLVSRRGVVPYSYTQDTAGPMARTVADAVKVLDVIRGFDPKDDCTAWSVGRTPGTLTAALIPDGLKGKRIGVLTSFFGDKDVHQDTNAAVRRAVDIMKREGAEILTLSEDFDAEMLVNEVSVHLHDLKDHLNDYLTHLGQTVSVHSVADILASGAHHPGIKENLLKASSLSTDTDVYKARLIRAAKVRDRFMLLLATHQLDAVVYPHQKQLVCKVGDSQSERNGVLASVTGFPSICVPAGYSRVMPEAPLGVPIGLEIMGRPFDESTLVEIAYGYEQASQVRKSPISAQTPSINALT
jgi:Asp-tRNA(Asn)/Glu-tRNA(Gln) amidotransferase A subunit family amidase